MSEPWTYASLAAQSRDTLERVLLDSPPPDLEALNGWIYCGWNHEWGAAALSGEKFKKGFWKRNGVNHGFNEVVAQDGKGPGGEWKVQMHGPRPVQLGYFRCSMTRDEKQVPLYRPYQHTAHFNYDLADLNQGPHGIFRPVRDFVVLPNPGDDRLLLCKAYFHLGYRTDVFYCYFLLGQRLKVDFAPW